MNQNLSPGRYRHFKGGEYEVIELARHSETEEWVVVYRPLYGEGGLWVRPLSLFADEKIIDGERVPRFRRIGEADQSAMAGQAQVADFCRAHDLAAPPQARLLDLCAELGELAKLWLEASDYGRRPTGMPERHRWQDELGDCLFTLFCLANETGIEAGDALEQTLAKYEHRLEKNPRPGSSGISGD